MLPTLTQLAAARGAESNVLWRLYGRLNEPGGFRFGSVL